MVFQGCEKEENFVKEQSVIENKSKNKSIAIDKTVATPYNYVGLLHNEGLDYIIDSRDNWHVNGQNDIQQLKVTSTDYIVSLAEAEYGAIDENSLRHSINMLIDEMDAIGQSGITFASYVNSSDLSTKAKSYIITLHNISTNNFEQTITDIKVV